jgi:hypothetical protein
MLKCFKVISFFLSIFIATHSYAQVSLSGGNMGYTSFMDGFGFPGFISDQYLYYYNADDFTDAYENKKPGKNKMHNLLLLTSFKYIAKNPKILGAWPGFDAQIPILLDLKVANDRFNQGETDIGDLFIGAFLQWPQMKLFNKIPIWQRAEILVKFPIGHYDSDNYVNAGGNTFAINPYYAFTAFVTKKIEVSMRLFYLWNSKNDDPAKITSPEWDPKSGTPPKFADSTQQGQAVWANFASSYGITDNFRLGINGYYLEQISNHKIDGHDIPNSRERVLAVGPGMMYISKNKKNLYWVNFYDEVLTKNRSQGVSGILRWLHVF